MSIEHITAANESNDVMGLDRSSQLTERNASSIRDTNSAVGCWNDRCRRRLFRRDDDRMRLRDEIDGVRDT